MRLRLFNRKSVYGILLVDSKVIVRNSNFILVYVELFNIVIILGSYKYVFGVGISL